VRAAPRHRVAAPATVTPLPHGEGALPAIVPPRPPRARLEYATDQELAADWIENLSQGGAFVRTPTPLLRGTELLLEIALPDGARLEAHALVVFVNDRGMGTRFVLSPEADELLAATITRISARPRRALVVDDDALVRAMLSDALSARGFEVMTATCGEAGLRTLAEELLALDLLVTDVCMPGMDGEEFVRKIRGAGGEVDLAIVVASGRLGPGVEERLEAAGADAVLDKALGPELVAQAADAALERKRLVLRADAA
jgi:CheY-like chemotaxis protein